MVTASTCTMTLPGPMLQRGFWLYVWQVETPKGEMLYVGRTGDNSSPHATAPYTRMGQHLGFAKTQNALRKHLLSRGVEPESCAAFHLIAHGPVYPEVAKEEGLDRAALMARHKPLRDHVGAMEKALAESLARAGYKVLNTVAWNHALDEDAWTAVRAAFADHFPKLKDVS
jgi:hypothetical protein